MNPGEPRFCVIIATHQRAALLERALLSLRAQSWGKLQVIVVSDVTDEATHRVAGSHLRDGDLFVLRKGRPGPSESRNIGMGLMQADYFLFLDDDDSFAPDFLAHCAALLASTEQGNAPACHFTNYEVVHEVLEGEQLQVRQIIPVDLSGQDPATVYVKNFVPNNCVIYPARLATEIRFDATIPYEDWDFLLSACDRVPLRHMVVSGPRIHKNAGTEHQQRGKANESSLLQCYLAVYARHKTPQQSGEMMRRALFASLGLDLERLQASVGGQS